MTIKDFQKLRFLGEGSYAKVMLVKYKSTGKTYAMKIILKFHMRKEKKEYQVKIERDVLANTNHVNIIRLFYTFRDEEKLYFVLEYAPNGDLAHLLHTYQILPASLAQHYAAEMVNMLEYLHSKGIAHRDLKPDNILLSDEYHLKLADFGTAKFMGQESNDDPLKKAKGTTFVGTAAYVSPEVLMDQESGPSSDLWALGCILYQFYAGRSPFDCKTEFLTFEAITKGKISYPPKMPPEAKDLCRRLLMMDPYKRLGSGPKDSELSYEALKHHEFFKGIDFENISKVKPSIEPEIIFKLQSERKVSHDLGAESPEEDNGDENPGDGETQVPKPEVKRGDEVVREETVSKKCGWIFYKRRKLVLTTRPRLSYYDPNSKEYKGDILLTKKVKAMKASTSKFNVITPNRTYNFDADTQASADEWVFAINEAIDKYCPELVL